MKVYVLGFILLILLVVGFFQRRVKYYTVATLGLCMRGL
jgi:hypothetical protein